MSDLERELALRIICGLEGDAVKHWETFYSKPRPTRDEGEGMWEYRARMSYQIKSRVCAELAEEIGNWVWTYHEHE